MILLGLLFVKNGIDDRDKMMTFDEKNIVVDMIPLNENASLQDSLFTETHEVHQPETNSLIDQADFRKIDSAFTNTTQQLEKSPPKIKSSADNTITDHQKNATATPDLSSPNPHPNKKLITSKTPDVVETAFPEKTGSQEVEDTKTTLPLPKPRITLDFHNKNQILTESFESGNNSTPQLSTSSQLRDKNTAALETKISEIRRLKREFIPELDLSKNAKFSIDEMLKHKKSKNSFQSSQPKPKTGIEKHQCKLVPMQKKKTNVNIRSIQNQIRSRRITISSILTNGSLQKSNEISISSLLASDLNTSSHNLRRKPDNI